MHAGGRRKKLAFLALAHDRCPDELLADFQQYYALDLWSMGLDGDEATRDVLRCAALAYQLPADGRVWRTLNPAGQHDQKTRLLRQMELNQRSWAWAHTKDAESKSNQPEPMLLDGEEEAYEEAVARQEASRADVADALGIKI